MRTSIHLPDDLLERAKKRAVEDGRTLTSLIEEGLRGVLAGRSDRNRQKRKLPRVSRAKGGLLPGIDPVKLLQHVEESEDMAALDRDANAR